MLHWVRTFGGVVSDALLGVLFLRSSIAIRAENLNLRRPLARYIDRGIKPRRMDHVTRVSLALLSKMRMAQLWPGDNRQRVIAQAWASGFSAGEHTCRTGLEC